eukprot:g432.t1
MSKSLGPEPNTLLVNAALNALRRASRSDGAAPRDAAHHAARWEQCVTLVATALAQRLQADEVTWSATAASGCPWEFCIAELGFGPRVAGPCADQMAKAKAWGAALQLDVQLRVQDRFSVVVLTSVATALNAVECWRLALEMLEPKAVDLASASTALAACGVGGAWHTAQASRRPI